MGDFPFQLRVEITENWNLLRRARCLSIFRCLPMSECFCFFAWPTSELVWRCGVLRAVWYCMGLVLSAKQQVRGVPSAGPTIQWEIEYLDQMPDGDPPYSRVGLSLGPVVMSVPQCPSRRTWFRVGRWIPIPVENQNARIPCFTINTSLLQLCADQFPHAICVESLWYIRKKVR